MAASLLTHSTQRPARDRLVTLQKIRRRGIQRTLCATRSGSLAASLLHQFIQRTASDCLVTPPKIRRRGTQRTPYASRSGLSAASLMLHLIQRYSRGRSHPTQKWDFTPRQTRKWDFTPRLTQRWGFTPRQTQRWDFTPRQTHKWDFTARQSQRWDFTPRQTHTSRRRIQRTLCMTTSYSSAAESRRLARTPEDDAKRPTDRKFAALPLPSKQTRDRFGYE